MHVIVAGEMQEFQVAEPVVLVVTVFMVDFCLLLHGEEQSAVPPSSALMLEEFSSGCVQSDVRSFSCAPVAPVAIIRADAFAQSSGVSHLLHEALLGMRSVLFLTES